MPDVNVSKVHSAEIKRYIKRDRYAAMQELDYCMNLKRNGGEFVQDYGNRKSEWNDAPVNLCHLISTTNQNGVEIERAYEYSMNVVKEYIMDFFTKHASARSVAKFCLDSHIINCFANLGAF